MKNLICAILSAAMLMTGCSFKKVDTKQTVATVNGTDISAEFYLFYLTQVKKQMNSGGIEDFWDTAELEGKKLIETAREKALDEVINAVIIEQKAKEQGITITKDEESSINSQVTSMSAQLGSRDKYNEWLKEQGLTDELYRRFIKINYLSQKLMNADDIQVTDADIKDYYEKNIARVKHILVLTTDSNNSPLSDEEVAKKREEAEGLLKRAKDGEDFDKLVEEYSEDPGSKSQPDGYYLGMGFILGSQGSMVSEFEEASLALKVGEVSDIVETTYGFHIIKRYENDPAVMEQNKDQLTSYAKNEVFTKLVESWKKDASVDVKNDIIEKL